jgi:hypothetical protein
MFGEVVCKIFAGSVPTELELFLGFAIAKPVIAHVDCAGAALFDGVVDETNGSSVVKCDWCGGLRVTEFFEGRSDGNGLFAINEGGSNFGVCGGGSDVSNNGGGIKDGTVGLNGFARSFRAEKEVATRTAAGTGFAVVSGVAVEV